MWRSSDCPAVATAAPQTPGCRLRPGRVMARAPGQASRAGPCTPALWWPTAPTRSTPGAPPKPGLSPSPAAAAPSSPGPDLQRPLPSPAPPSSLAPRDFCILAVRVLLWLGQAQEVSTGIPELLHTGLGRGRGAVSPGGVWAGTGRFVLSRPAWGLT